jgi:hypothetical protein
VSLMSTGLPKASTRTKILLVSAPRDRPIVRSPLYSCSHMAFAARQKRFQSSSHKAWFAPVGPAQAARHESLNRRFGNPLAEDRL